MRQFTTLVLLVFVCACSSQPSTIRYYLLHTPADSRQLDLLSTPEIKLHKLIVPDYLKQRGLPLLLASNQVHISKTHVWAESFERSLQKRVKYEFEPDYLIHNAGTTATPAIQLSIEIQHLIATNDGELIISANYQLATNNDVFVRQAYTKTYALTEDGFSHTIDVHNIAIADLVSEIKHQLADSSHI